MKDAQMMAWGKYLAMLFLLIAGIVICGLWRRLIQRYAKLLKWWFEQLRELEKKLPESSMLLNAEYNALYEKGHIGIGRYENILTWVFTIMFAVFGLVTFVLLLSS